MLCGFCRRAMPHYSADLDTSQVAHEAGLDAIALRYQYVSPLDTVLKRYKYQGELMLAGPLAQLLPPPPLSVLSKHLNQRPPVLIPVPSSPARIKKRGFDHLHLIAMRYARRFNLEMAYAKRNLESASQAKLGRRDRKRNLTEVFEVDRLGKAVLLIDDVITTGATLSALAERCRENGANWVGAVVLARAPGPSDLITL